MLGDLDGSSHFPLPSMNRLNQTEPATFAILLIWASFWAPFLYFYILFTCEPCLYCVLLFVCLHLLKVSGFIGPCPYFLLLVPKCTANWLYARCIHLYNPASLFYYSRVSVLSHFFLRELYNKQMNVISIDLESGQLKVIQWYKWNLRLIFQMFFNLINILNIY